MIRVTKNNIENSENRNSDVPGTEYTIAYHMGDYMRYITIRAQSPFLAFQKFKEDHPETFKYCAVKQLDSKPAIVVEKKPSDDQTPAKQTRRVRSIWEPPLPSVMSLLKQNYERYESTASCAKSSD